MRLTIHLTQKASSDFAVGADAASVQASAPPGRVRITGGPAAQRFEQPEKRLADLEDEHDAFRAEYDKDFGRR
jgi:hypothetical protein